MTKYTEGVNHYNQIMGKNAIVTEKCNKKTLEIAEQ